MKVELFDDKFSLLHLLFGVAIGFSSLKNFVLTCFVLYMIFQMVEHMYKYGKETSESFIGDLVEFIFGVGVGYLLAVTGI